MQSFAQQFKSPQWVSKNIALPTSNFLTERVFASIQEMEDLVTLSSMLEGNGYDSDFEIKDQLETRFHLTNEQVAQHAEWQYLAIQCLDLQDLSSKHDNTWFVCIDRNQSITNGLESEWEKLLFAHPEFRKLLYLFTKIKIEYENLDLSIKYQGDCHTFNILFQAQEDVNTFVAQIDQRLSNIATSKELYECEVNQYSGILKALGIDFSVIPDPIDDVVPSVADDSDLPSVADDSDLPSVATDSDLPSVATDSDLAKKQFLEQEIKMKLEQIKFLNEDLERLQRELALLD